MAGKTTPRLIATCERRTFVLDLRKRGVTYDRIALATIAHFGADNLPSGFDSLYAAKDVMRAIDKLNREINEDVDAIRTLELERLDRMFMEMYGQAIQGVAGAVDRCLRIMERRSKLLGLDKPPEIRIGGIEGAPPIREVIIERVKPIDDDATD